MIDWYVAVYERHSGRFRRDVRLAAPPDLTEGADLDAAAAAALGIEVGLDEIAVLEAFADEPPAVTEEWVLEAWEPGATGPTWSLSVPAPGPGIAVPRWGLVKVTVEQAADLAKAAGAVLPDLPGCEYELDRVVSVVGPGVGLRRARRPTRIVWSVSVVDGDGLIADVPLPTATLARLTSLFGPGLEIGEHVLTPEQAALLPGRPELPAGEASVSASGLVGTTDMWVLDGAAEQIPLPSATRAVLAAELGIDLSADTVEVTPEQARVAAEFAEREVDPEGAHQLRLLPLDELDWVRADRRWWPMPPPRSIQ